MQDRMAVKITLTSTQDGESVIHTYTGEWFRKERSVYIRYEEPVEGDAAPIRTLVRFRKDELSITRRGALESEQLFVPGELRRSGYYRSPYTSFQMETGTAFVVVKGDDGAELPSAEPPCTIEWQYELWMNEHLSGRFHNRLHIQEE
ncbi:Uncharacterized beta-barrel protein YwiB, DUF1934 family [Paenibacillus catalpae]|uniref:Uncharacterized beta-barrel protein YwiB, DUF1934 family n=1 Tax=Paenibacillus catalpae TaxID=1045775 RepID=A0A1I2I1A2_9BACL|nr:DUF1934 domain-containing protein [Paenibacillus catalpae]SFF34686.1 Uncharacterized beta-barrel protein YwiB, DUF1934 family [Paenibacillus catalpae]